MSDKKPDWELPRHDPDVKSDAQKRADIWSKGPATSPKPEEKRFTFNEFDEARGRKSPYIETESDADAPPPSGKKRLFLFFGALFILYWLLKAFNPSVSIFDDPYSFRSMLIILVIGGSVVYFSRASNSAVFKALFGWVAIIAVISSLYIMNKGSSYSLVNDMTPSRIVSANGEMQVQRANDGHFWIMTQVNGQNLPMMVDTGASMVVLSKRDAKQVGISLGQLRFNGTSSTANGTVAYARTRLDSFQIGHVSFNNFMVTVNGGEMEGSLLGLDALNEFTSYEMRGDVMILRP